MLQLPRGGGAIRGIGEKFTADPATGTGSMSVPIPTSPGRSGLSPQLTLTYGTGSGNGVFGFGWNLSLASITRKTDKGLPRYLDGVDSDDFILSGAEDLVPVYRQDPGGDWVADHPGFARDAVGFWVRDASDRLVVHEDEIDGYRVRRYRPRIEGLFARIERWTRIDAPADVHWRSISKDNTLTLYGFDTTSRIADPLDPGRIFSWLICESRDDRGNGIRYLYKAEDGAFDPLPGQPDPFAQAHQRNRGSASDARRTAQRYPHRVLYGNRTPLLDADGRRPRHLSDLADPPGDANADWLFEVRFDYGELDDTDPAGTLERPWRYRPDAFSTYRPGFEVRTCRRCERVLMIHHIPDQPASGGRPAQAGYSGVVSSTDFTYDDELDPGLATKPVFSFLAGVVQTGWTQAGGETRRRSLPPLQFEYTRPVVQEVVEEVDAKAMENLPIGSDGDAYRWIDLHGEGLPGILTEQGGAWFYKRNRSPLGSTAHFGDLETVALKPAATLIEGADVMDLAGDGQPDVVVMQDTVAGLYEHDGAEGWHPFRPFASNPNRDARDPNVRFVDLDGDGRADVLITQDDALIWHPSLGDDGFGNPQRIAQAIDEEKGPRVVFADGTQSVHLADFSGDGLADLVRIRNGDVCYWPNLGYGRFGAKIAMDEAPWFDNPEQFDQRRIRLADVDGSGTTDIVYLHRDGARLFFNQSGNGWSRPQQLAAFPHIDDAASIVAMDLLGNGTTALVWSSALPRSSRRPMRYVDLMGGTKPHLLVRSVNNLGAETQITYAPSTRFFLQDRDTGTPWITRLPFPVHVVERIETIDHVSRNRFVTRYAYHHGYFDGEEREFRGFGMVEQWDTEELGALAGGDAPVDDVDAASHVPPVHTKTWFHTGVHMGRDHVSDYFAGLLDAADTGEYYREPGLPDAAARDLLLPDTVLPGGLTSDEEREACRALKGAMLRQEVFADDAAHPGATAAQIARAHTPYTVTEQNFGIRTLQPRGANRYGVFLTHPREALTFNYERNRADPRVRHAMTLEVDDHGSILKVADIAYGRRSATLPGLWERDRQGTALLTYTENRATNAIDATDVHRTPLPCEAVTFELTGYPATGPAGRYRFEDLVEPDPAGPGRLRHVFAPPEVAYEETASGSRRRRPIEHIRTLYRRDDLTALLPLGTLGERALAGESYKLAFTPGLLEQVFQRARAGQPPEALLPDPAAVLGGRDGDRGGYVPAQTLRADGRFPATDPDDHWWLPSGRSFLSAGSGDDPAAERAQARLHFFRARRHEDAFGQSTFVDFDAWDLLVAETRDALSNRITVDANDYRVLQPRVVSDPNRNRIEVAFDALGMVAGTAVMGKRAPAPAEGDSLAGFETDLSQAQLDSILDADDPRPAASTLLKDATTRIVYDLDRFRRTRQAYPDDPAKWQPPATVTIARETHVNAALPAQGLKIQLGFDHSDGFGREIQKKRQAEPGPAPQRDAAGAIVVGPDGHPVLTPGNAPLRWVGSGWTVYNNKGKPVRQYEPFFTDTHRFEFDVRIGVSPVLWYDPADRVIATLRPDATYEKVVFDAWQQTTWDGNDTCAPRDTQTGDPRTDPDIAGFVAGYFRTQPAGWQTWHGRRIGGALGQDERDAAVRAAAHADTPTTEHYDVLGRPIVTVTRNRVTCPGHALDGTEDSFSTRVELDIEGNERSVRDERRLTVDDLPVGAIEQRIVVATTFDMLGNRIRHRSMEAGTRWTLADAMGRTIRTWDDRGHVVTTRHDALRRPVEKRVRGTLSVADPVAPNSDPRTFGRDILVERTEYGEPPPGATPAEEAEAQRLNLRTRVYRRFDSAGIATSARLDAQGRPVEAYDFKGNLLRSTRRLVSDYSSIPDWAADPPLDAETFEDGTRYDAMNRPVQSIAPHSTVPPPGGPGAINVLQSVFNEANLLERVDVWLARVTEPAGLIDPAGEARSPVGVAGVAYDARGQRILVDYTTDDATVIRTTSTYDRDTHRLIRQYTRRGVDPATAQGVAFADDSDNPSPPPATVPAPEQPPAGLSAGVQNLRYTYDPAGNITHIRDDAQQAVFFRNRRVDPDGDYVYDALYRVIQASGREHLGQAGGAPIPHSADDSGRVGLLHPGDGNVMGTYTERYVYDAVGNFLQLQHRGSDPAHAGWTTAYAYDEPSLIEPGKRSNRLSRTVLAPAGSAPQPQAYLHDVHGGMLRMAHLGGTGPNMHWDWGDRVRQVDKGGGGTVHYVYDAAGERVRKVWEKAPGLVEEQVYLGGFEVFRRHGGTPGAAPPTLERETLHIADDTRRFALVETRTRGAEPGVPPRMIRNQFGDHLGSSGLELSEQGHVVSYEEYSPYGSTTYQAVRSQTGAPKRYRHAGRERDEETGFSHYDARYYAPWLGRWISSDPAGIEDDLDSYAFARQSPIPRREVDGRKSKKITIEGEVITLDDAGQVKVAKKSRSEVLVDGQGKTKELKKTERDMNKTERAAAQVRMDALRAEMAERVAKEKEAAAEREKQKPPEKYKVVIGINVSSVDKKENVRVTGGADGNPGHTFLAIKDPSGKIIRILSYGPVKQGALGGIGCSAPGDAKYHLLANDDFETYEWEVTKEQSDKAVKKIDEIDKAPGTYSGTHQCTSVALEVTDEIGLTTIPRGKGNIDIPLCDDPTGVPTPYHLNKELKAAGMPSKTMKGSDFKGQGVPVH